ncbi:MAG: 4Fe-4S dicluster domain-containing protein [Verrucomicrobiales bacterium]|nr:4Fe-4S dicluster domain-containing protein [Verrucomicrobiales bacterium]
MLHAIPAEDFGPLGPTMARAVQACVHCGFCLAACPTYQELGQEMDSPRGRIVLMKEVLEGTLDWRAAQPHVDRCLGCLACEPACPSGVLYRDLISPFRALARRHFARSRPDRLRNWLVARTLPYPGRVRTAAGLGRIGKALPNLVPGSLRPMLDLLPSEIPRKRHWPDVVPAQGERRARVGLLLGCAQQVLDPDINDATLAVLSRHGVEVHLPANQTCCGGLAWHTGDLEAARTFARANLAAFPSNLDAIVTNAAGCGSALHEYPHSLAGTPDAARARDFAPRVLDVAVFLRRLGLRAQPRGFGKPVKIAYQDACHLANAQGVRQDPRVLLRSIPGVTCVELADAHLCCGSAGSYNIDQPEIAASLGEQKARAILATGADLVASGNIGCLTQIRFHLKRLGSAVPARHTMQILRDADPS